MYKENNISDKVEIVVIIPSNDKKPCVEWYKITDELELEKIWDLDFLFNIVHVNYMLIEDKHLLLLIDEKYENSTVCELYTFDLHQKGIW